MPVGVTQAMFCWEDLETAASGAASKLLIFEIDSGNDRLLGGIA